MTQKRKRQTVILDTNFLFIPRNFKIDIFEELRGLMGNDARCVITRTVILELEQLKASAGPSFGREVNFAQQVAERCEIFEDEIKSGEDADDSIIRVAVEEGYAVATNDAEFRRRLKDSKVPTIFVRQGAYLDSEGYLQ